MIYAFIVLVFASIANVSVSNGFVKMALIPNNKVILNMKGIAQMKKMIKLIATAMEDYRKSMDYYGTARIKVYKSL
jgi:hypothetical protein